MKSFIAIAPLVALLCTTRVYGVVVVAPMESPDPMVSPMVMAPDTMLPMVSPDPLSTLPVGPPPPIAGMNTTWANAYFRGTPNNFGLTPMTFSNGLWRITVAFNNTSSERFKIARFEDWTEAYPANDFYISQGAGKYDITFDEVSREVTARKVDGTVDVQFQCDKGLTSLGQSVYAVGNVTELGSWNLASAVLLSSATYPSWRKTIPIAIGQDIAWKCVKRSETTPTANVVYEPGFNNLFTASTPTTVFGSF